MKLATWNVNSLKVRLPHLVDWLQSAQPDIICLQELKLEDSKFPSEALQAAGYTTVSSGQKTYNGVAILARRPLEDVQTGIPGVVCLYAPNGQALDSDKFEYKLRWYQALREWLAAELLRYPDLAVLGDLNIAPEDRDVHDPKAWEGQTHVSAPERAAFNTLLELGLRDSFRLFEQPEKSYSWWDYREFAFRRNRGLRIDYILVSEPLKPLVAGCVIDKLPRKNERPSDHVPVVVELG